MKHSKAQHQTVKHSNIISKKLDSVTIKSCSATVNSATLKKCKLIVKYKVRQHQNLEHYRVYH